MDCFLKANMASGRIGMPIRWDHAPRQKATLCQMGQRGKSAMPATPATPGAAGQRSFAKIYHSLFSPS
jgi:hypothetical protein